MLIRVLSIFFAKENEILYNLNIFSRIRIYVHRKPDRFNKNSGLEKGNLSLKKYYFYHLSLEHKYLFWLMMLKILGSARRVLYILTFRSHIP